MMFNPPPKRGGTKTKKLWTRLQYRIKRYQSMGNGPMCQALNGKLQKLLAKQASAM